MDVTQAFDNFFSSFYLSGTISDGFIRKMWFFYNHVIYESISETEAIQQSMN